MTARPSVFPDWALLDATDPTSGQNNVVEPPAAWKNYGWSYTEKPPRNYWNWLGRWTANWLHYLDEQRLYTLQDLPSLIVQPAGETTFTGGAPDWASDVSNLSKGFVAASSGKMLYYRVPPPIPGCSFSWLMIKVYNADGGTQTPIIGAEIVDPNLVAYDTSPSKSPLWTNVTTVPGVKWGVLSYGPLGSPVSIPNGGHVLLSIDSRTAGDCVAAVVMGFTSPVAL
jgi:hypothetical protein